MADAAAGQLIPDRLDVTALQPEDHLDAVLGEEPGDEGCDVVRCLVWCDLNHALTIAL